MIAMLWAVVGALFAIKAVTSVIMAIQAPVVAPYFALHDALMAGVNGGSHSGSHSGDRHGRGGLRKFVPATFAAVPLALVKLELLQKLIAPGITAIVIIAAIVAGLLASVVVIG